MLNPGDRRRSSLMPSRQTRHGAVLEHFGSLWIQTLLPSESYHFGPSHSTQYLYLVDQRLRKSIIKPRTRTRNTSSKPSAPSAMAFCITFGTHEFSSPLQGYEGITAQCHNCGNWSAQCVKRWPWFTVCFVPVIPLGGKHKEVACPICHFMQDLQNRPDIQSQAGGGGAAPPIQHQGQQGWGGPGPGGPSPGGPPRQQYK